MLKTVLIVVLVLLILFVFWSMLRKALGLLFKIAFFTLILLIVFATAIYVDLKRQNLDENTVLIIADDTTIYGGFEINKGQIGNAVVQDEISKIDYNSIKESNYAEINYKGKYALVIFIVAEVNASKLAGNQSKTTEAILEIVEGNNKNNYKTTFDILSAIKYEKIYFFPKTLTLRQVELLNNI